MTSEVVAVRYGTLSTSKSALFYRYGAYGDADVTQQMDYFFWVVRSAGQITLVDTGFAPDVGERRGRTNVITVSDALARLDIAPADVAQVVLTHFHYDHIGNVDLFPDAELVVPAAELDFYTGPLASRPQIAEHVERSEIDIIVEADKAGRVTLVEDTAEIAAGITADIVGGHAPGQMIVTVDTGAGDVVLTSDAVHLYEELHGDRPFSVFVDLPGMYATFDLLLEKERAGATVVPGHDPDVTTRFPAVAAELDGIAHVLS